MATSETLAEPNWFRREEKMYRLNAARLWHPVTSDTSFSEYQQARSSRLGNMPHLVLQKDLRAHVHSLSLLGS